MMKNHYPRKCFGQHFLQDEHVIQQIVAAIDPHTSDHLVEIGPGLGALTIELLQSAGHLDAIELDRDLIPDLINNCKSYGQLTIHQADALTFNFADLSTAHKKLRIVGNLPYNISTPLIFHLLDYLNCIVDMHFMLQQEVVTRLAAPVGSSAYGRLSVMVQYLCDVVELFSVPPTAFHPPPKVFSAVVLLQPRTQQIAIAKDPVHFSRVVQQAFSQRRKTLRNTLKGLMNSADLINIGIDPELRPQQLSVTDYVRISNHLA